MTLAAIYQAVLEDVLLILVEDSREVPWKMLQPMHVGVEWINEAMVHTLKSELKTIDMKDDE